jgi:FlaA1/EpsC-like NDP-sugar epimerase
MRSKFPRQIPDVAMEDLLERLPASLEEDLVRSCIQGRVVMVTGAAGSIGSELLRQLARFAPSGLICFDQAETPLFELERELGREFPALAIHYEMGNVVRFDDVSRAMRRYKPAIVFHAAAYKHVYMAERQPFAALENNVFGTWNVARAAAAIGVDSFVMISTDKAVRPASMMGVSKRVAEMLIQSIEKPGSTKFIIVRFGNVIGSSGSVVPIFKNQIVAGGPVTVTHAEMSRYFMTAPEAAQLVLQALAMGKGGEIFVLDMGEPIRILDLARKLIRLSGFEPDADIRIEFTRPRSGEKLMEELSAKDEELMPTRHVAIRNAISAKKVDAARMNTFIEELQQAANARSFSRALLLLKEMTPDYVPGPELLSSFVSTQDIYSTQVAVF